MTQANNDTIWAIVPAAGSSRRMGGDLPKQYLPLLGKTVLEHTLQRLLNIGTINEIVLALHRDDRRFDVLPVSQNQKIQVVIGGSERSKSVFAALMSLQGKARLTDWVLVHDAARCCVLADKINELLRTLAEDEVGGILAVPASDTLKKIGSGSKIMGTLNRDRIWQAQTPQLFRYGLLRQALEQAQEQQLNVTDEASALELAAYKPKVVMGHYDNIKITHPEDVAIARAIMQQQNNKEKVGGCV